MTSRRAITRVLEAGRPGLAPNQLVTAGASAVLVGATTADVLWSIGVFVGVPGLMFVVLVVREFRRLRVACRELRRDTREMREEGFAPGPPVDSDPQTPE